MGFESILAIAGLLGMFAGLVGAIVNGKGEVIGRLAGLWIRILFVAVGVTLLVIAIRIHGHKERDFNKRIDDLEARVSVIDVGAFQISALVSRCSSTVVTFEARWPEIPGLNAAYPHEPKETRVVLPRADEGNEPPRLDVAIENLFRRGPDAKYVIVSPGGSGKSIAAQASEYHWCRSLLRGESDVIPIRVDARKDVRSAEVRDKYLDELIAPAIVFASKHGLQIVLLVDSYDELFFDSTDEANALRNWVDRAGKAGATVFVFSRSYAADPLINDGYTKIVAQPPSDERYREWSVRSLVFHTFFGPRARLVPPANTDISRWLTTKTNESIAYLKNAHLWDRQLSYRDVEAALYDYLGSPDVAGVNGPSLGPAYVSFIQRRVQLNLALLEEQPDIERVIKCAAQELLRTKSVPAVAACDVKNWETLRVRAELDIKTAESTAQDVVGAQAICLLSCKGLYEPSVRGLLENAQASLIAATAFPSCTCRNEVVRHACRTGDEDRKKYALTCESPAPSTGGGSAVKPKPITPVKPPTSPTPVVAPPTTPVLKPETPAAGSSDGSAGSGTVQTNPPAPTSAVQASPQSAPTSMGSGADLPMPR